MTDDLRTRAERAAAVEHMEFSSDDPATRAQTATLRAAFVDGALWHAAQQPTVDEVAQAIRVADGNHTMGAGQLAEVVHALFQGAGS